MKRIVCAVMSAALCLSLLCACGDDGSSSEAASQAAAAQGGAAQNGAPDQGGAAQQGNDSSFNLSESHLQSVLACAWANKSDYNEKIQFAEDLSFTHFIKGERIAGKAELDESSGTLTMKYDGEARPTQSYAWVDKLSNVNAATWYVDGGTFAYGGNTFIKDAGI